jgi:adenine-specific DNA methylase
LELSEIWNAILNKDVSFEKEIVVSNAKARNKTKEKYKDMSNFIVEINRILSNEGVFLLYYNARDKESWKFMEMVGKMTNFEFFGAFPLEYSANSVVQDNRKGGLKTDYALIMKRKGINTLNVNEFDHIPGWLTSLSQVVVTY